VLNRNLKDLVEFAPAGPRRQTLFETDHLWTQLLCFDRNQHIGPVTDHDADAVFTVVAGEAVFIVDRRRKRFGQWETVLVKAGSQVTVTNASVEPLVVLLVASPPPPAHAVTG
jgi:mannose-6-phosphate isomerase-like protein (cupin superfamily)